MLTAKANAQTALFQWKILKPSRIPSGIRLKTAMYPLKKAPIANAKKIHGSKLGTNTNPRNAVDKTRLVAGPAIEIFPISFMLAGPEIITAPGEIILKGKIMEIPVKTEPQTVKRNSAHKPRLCAVTLCAISCIKNEKVITAARAEKIRVQFGCPKESNPNDKLMPITSNVPRAKCLSSFGLK